MIKWINDEWMNDTVHEYQIEREKQSVESLR